MLFVMSFWFRSITPERALEVNKFYVHWNLAIAVISVEKLKLGMIQLTSRHQINSLPVDQAICTM